MEDSGLTTNMQPVNIINLTTGDGGNHDGEKGGTKYVNMFKTVFNFIANAPIVKVIKFFAVIIITTLLIITGVSSYKFFTSEQGVGTLTKYFETILFNMEEEAMDIRSSTTPKIQKELSILCHTLHADRAFIFEVHNGKRNSTGLPFKFADMTYEVVNGEKNHEYVGRQFQELTLSLYKFPHHLAERKYFFGGVRTVAVVDNAFARHVESVGGQYLAMMYMTSNGVGVGFLCVSFHDDPKFSYDEVKVKMMQHGKIISELLDLSVQRDKRYKEQLHD